jgi:hypothetical protein
MANYSEVVYAASDISREVKRFARQFDYSDNIAQLLTLEQQHKTVSNELEGLQQRINEMRSNLPEEIVQLYDKYRVVEALID